MADFRPAFNWMIQHEGGLSDDPNDAGGLTKYGISQRAYPDLDIRSLTIEDAAQIYQRDYWQPNPYRLINSQEVANKVFDLCVNMGSFRANKILQKSCNDCGNVIVVDGKIGPLTIRAINQSDSAFLLDALRENAKHFYMTLAAEKPSNQKFLNGWIKRAMA